MTDDLSESDKLAFATGYCIFSWAKVEVALYALFSSAFNTVDLVPALAVWDSIQTFHNKLKALDAAIRSVLSLHTDYKELLEIWNEVVISGLGVFQAPQ